MNRMGNRTGRKFAYRWLLLDADGTLLDFAGPERLALVAAPRDLGVSVPKNFVATYHEVNDSLWRSFEAGALQAHDVRTLRFRRVVERLNLDVDPDRLSEAFLRHVVDESTFLDGAKTLLQKLSDGIGLLLLTNGFADVQRARLKRLQIADMFDHILISEEVNAAKPGRAIFEIAFQRMGLPRKEEVLMVGDSLRSDIRGGSEFGIDTCWFNPGGDRNTSGIAPTYEISRLAELPPLLGAEDACHGSFAA
jgi:2-haloacid dehalogenase